MEKIDIPYIWKNRIKALEYGQYTEILHVHADGNNSDGKTWDSAYQNLADALDQCSTDVNDLTLILVAPKTGNVHYDINRAGDPTWSANVEIVGNHRTWAKIKNDHASATSVMNFSGYASLIDLNINLGTSNNGVKFTKGAFRARHVQFVGEDLTSAKTALHLDGASTIKHGIIEDCQFKGHPSYMTGILIDNCSLTEFKHLRIHDCLIGIQITDDGSNASDNNHFDHIDIGHCGTGVDIDVGSNQHFVNILFHSNTRNVDDEVGDHTWDIIQGSFPISITPGDLNGTSVPTHADANTYGTATTLVSGVDNPFSIVALTVEPSTSEWYMMKLSDGTTYFDYLLFEANRKIAAGFPSGTAFIFNKGTTITAELKDETGGDTCNVWVKIQEI